MGIFPYQTPAEAESFEKRLKHYDDFLTEMGYRRCDDIYGKTQRQIKKDKKKYKAPDGKTYKGLEEFKKGYGTYPLLVKNDVYYSLFDPVKFDNYVNPFEDECNFLRSKGYVPGNPFSDDYFENNRLAEEFYNKNGYVPRWIKNSVGFSQEKALEIEGYKYNEWR